MKIGLVINTRRRRASIIPALVRSLSAKGHLVVAEPAACRQLGLGCRTATPKGLVSGTDLIIAMGGDGTLLRAAGLVGQKGTPILGVNLGELGFLTEFTWQQAKEAIDSFARGEYREEQRMMLEVRHGRKRYFVLNDATLNMGSSCRAIEIVLTVNEHHVTRFVADGVVIATPTGSTAYSLAAGGPIVFPTLEAILVTPICAHALSARPVVAAPEERIGIELGPKNAHDALLTTDGRCRGRVKPGELILIARADFKTRLITPHRKSYYEILRNKMKWGGRDEVRK